MSWLSDTSSSRSPRTSTRSARWPSAIRPRFATPNASAATEVAAASASALLMPARADNLPTTSGSARVQCIPQSRKSRRSSIGCRALRRAARDLISAGGAKRPVGKPVPGRQRTRPFSGRGRHIPTPVTIQIPRDDRERADVDGRVELFSTSCSDQLGLRKPATPLRNSCSWSRSARPCGAVSANSPIQSFSRPRTPANLSSPRLETPHGRSLPQVGLHRPAERPSVQPVAWTLVSIVLL